MSESKTSRRKTETAERRLRIIEARKRGHTLQAIADQEGISPQAVHKQIRLQIDAWKLQCNEEVRALVELESQRLDEAHKALWPKAIRGHLPSIDRVIKIMERRAKLLGLDAPARTELTGANGAPFTGGGLAALLREVENNAKP